MKSILKGLGFLIVLLIATYCFPVFAMTADSLHSTAEGTSAIPYMILPTDQAGDLNKPPAAPQEPPEPQNLSLVLDSGGPLRI